MEHLLQRGAREQAGFLRACELLQQVQALLEGLEGEGAKAGSLSPSSTTLTRTSACSAAVSSAWWRNAKSPRRGSYPSSA